MKNGAVEHCIVLLEGLLLRPTLPPWAPSLAAFVDWLAEEATEEARGGREREDPWAAAGAVEEDCLRTSTEGDDL